MAKTGRKVDETKTPATKILPGNNQEKPSRQISPVEEAAHIGSLYRTAGINLSLPNVAVLLRLNNLYYSKGLKATIEDIQMVINSVARDPSFKPDQQQ